MLLVNDVVMITGAGSGMGRATSLYLSSRGASVGIVDVRMEAAQAVKDEILRAGRKAVSCVCDVRIPGQIYEAVAHIENRLGPLTAQVNCAGLYRFQPFLEVAEADWDIMMDVNAKGVFFCVQAAAKSMVERKRGTIVNISSVAGRHGRPLNAQYAASKAAVLSITQSAAKALGPHNIRVNAICPGIIQTPMWDEVVRARKDMTGKEGIEGILDSIPLRRIGYPEEVAALICYLISNDGAYINGQAINLCGGLEMD